MDRAGRGENRARIEQRANTEEQIQLHNSRDPYAHWQQQTYMERQAHADARGHVQQQAHMQQTLLGQQTYAQRLPVIDPHARMQLRSGEEQRSRKNGKKRLVFAGMALITVLCAAFAAIMLWNPSLFGVPGIAVEAADLTGEWECLRSEGGDDYAFILRFAAPNNITYISGLHQTDFAIMFMGEYTVQDGNTIRLSMAKVNSSETINATYFFAVSDNKLTFVSQTGDILPSFSRAAVPTEFDRLSDNGEIPVIADTNDTSALEPLPSLDETGSFTGGDYRYTLTNGQATIVEYTGREAVVTIPDQLDGYLVTSIGDNVFKYCGDLTGVTIPDNVTSIGDHAFSECNSLISITIPGSVTNIGEMAFSFCKSATNVTIGKGVRHICNNAFYGCSGLTNATLPDSVLWIGYAAFESCPILTLMVIEGSCAHQYAIDNGIPYTFGTIPFEPSDETRPQDPLTGGWGGHHEDDESGNPLVVTQPVAFKGIGNTNGNLIQGGYIAGDSTCVFFRNFDDEGRLYVRDEVTGKLSLVSDITNVSQINIMPEWVYFSQQTPSREEYGNDYANTGAFFRARPGGGETQSFTMHDGLKIAQMMVYDGYIYFVLNHSADNSPKYNAFDDETSMYVLGRLSLADLEQADYALRLQYLLDEKGCRFLRAGIENGTLYYTRYYALPSYPLPTHVPYILLAHMRITWIWTPANCAVYFLKAGKSCCSLRLRANR